MKKQKDILPMSKKERQRYHLLKLVIEGSITLKEASTIMIWNTHDDKSTQKGMIILRHLLQTAPFLVLFCEKRTIIVLNKFFRFFATAKKIKKNRKKFIVQKCDFGIFSIFSLFCLKIAQLASLKQGVHFLTLKNKKNLFQNSTLAGAILFFTN